jgi:hypothetical protein
MLTGIFTKSVTEYFMAKEAIQPDGFCMKPTHNKYPDSFPNYQQGGDCDESYQ